LTALRMSPEDNFRRASFPAGVMLTFSDSII
jgi:hypothetical protein